MGRACVVFGCKNHSSIKKAGLSTHNFPRDKKLRQIWIDNIGRESLPASESSLVLCSEHFQPECFQLSSTLKNSLLGTKKLTFLKSDAVPTIFSHKALSHPREDTIKRLQEHDRKEMVNALLNSPNYGNEAVPILITGISQNNGSTSVTNLPDYQGDNQKICQMIENLQKINPEEDFTHANSFPNLVKTDVLDDPVKIKSSDDLPKIESSDLVNIEHSDDLVNIEPSDDLVNIEPSDDLVKIEPSDDLAKIEPTDFLVKIEPLDDSIDNIQFEEENILSCGDFPSAKEYIDHIKTEIVKQSPEEKMPSSQSTLQNASVLKISVNTSSFKINSSDHISRQSLSRASIKVGGSSTTSDQESPVPNLNLSTILIPSLPSLKLNQSCKSLSVTSPSPTYVTFKSLIKVEHSEEKVHQESWIDKISAEEGLISTITIEKVFGVSEELQNFG